MNGTRNTDSGSQAQSALEHYSNHFDGSRGLRRMADETSRPDQAAYQLRPSFGHGWMDMHAFGNGVTTGRMSWNQIQQDEAQERLEFPDNVCLGLLTQGAYDIESLNATNFGPGDVFLRNGHPGQARRSATSSVLAGVSVDLPRNLLDTLQEEGMDVTCLGAKNRCAVLKPSQGMADELHVLGCQMLALQTRHSTLARIELESLSLGFLLKLLEACAASTQRDVRQLPKRWQIALDDALDIVHTEWSRPLTIAQLARRAGINECYLKLLFRERTGMGVAAYLRQLRMQHARQMIESGNMPIKQVAWHCGYANAAKFAQAFRSVHHKAPSELR